MKRHHRAIIAVVLVVALAVAAVFAYGYYLNSSLNNVDRISIDSGRRVQAMIPEKNILLMGVDHASGSRPDLKEFNIAEDTRKGVWPVDKYNSDTIMVVHVSKDRKRRP